MTADPPANNGSSDPRSASDRRRLSAARLTLACNLTLAILKLGVGVTTASVAILSDGLNSSCDLVATGLTYFAVTRSGRPPDPKHPWGHGKYESLAGMVESLVIFGAGVYIVVEAARDLESTTLARPGVLGLLVMTASLIINALLARRVLVIAAETESIALASEGQHVLTDVFTSAGVLISLLLSRFFQIPHMQAIAALLVSMLIFRAAYKVSLVAIAPLLDQALPPDETRRIHDLLSHDDRVLDFHNLRTRRSGAIRMVDVHILMSDDLSFIEAHRRTEALENEIRSLFRGRTDVIIHPEPFHEEVAHQREHHGEALSPVSPGDDSAAAAQSARYLAK